MFVFRDALADPVLLTIDAALLALGQMTVVLRHVGLFAVLHGGLAVLEIGRLLRVQLAAADAVGDALLLILFAAVDLINARMTGIDDARPRSGSGCGLSRGGTGDHKSPHCQD